MGKKAKFTKTEFRLAVHESGGKLEHITARLNVTRRTVYRYFDRYPDLKADFNKERNHWRDGIVELAKSKLEEGLHDADPARVDRLVMFALRHYDKDGVPGAVDLGSLFAPDVLEIMKKQGVEPSDVVKEFEAIMRAQAAKQHA